MRKIIHIDMDAFYAAVEQRDNPSFRGKPVVVGGRPDSRGVVATASYEARKLGIHSGLPSSKAYRLCPSAIFFKPRFKVYKAVSSQIQAIFYEYTDLVEPLSLDEAFLDVTINKKNIASATKIANLIRREIFLKTKLTASAGVAANKFLAKIASDINKPNGIKVITPEQADSFIEQLPIGKFYGIGIATEKKMLKLGIKLGKDLKKQSKTELIKNFGKSGYFYYNIAKGEDLRPVSPDRKRKSVGAEQTFQHDIQSIKHMRALLNDICKEVEKRLRKIEAAGKTVTLKVRYPDFKTVTRSFTGDFYLNDCATFSRITQELLKTTEADKKRIRLLGVTVSNLNINQTVLENNQLELPI